MNICVYGAASKIISDVYINETYKLGAKLAQRGHKLVFGGGGAGVMGAVAKGVFDNNGDSIGVVPTFFNIDGILFDSCTKMIRTETMRERKKAMEDNADAFIVAPGGIGTFDEFFEILTLKQLGRHNKPIAVFDVNNYYDALDKFMENTVNENFMPRSSKGLYKMFTNLDNLFDYIENYKETPKNIFELRYANK